VLAVLYVALALALGGCAGFSRVLSVDAALATAPPANSADAPAAPDQGTVLAAETPRAVEPPTSVEATGVSTRESVSVMESAGAASETAPEAAIVVGAGDAAVAAADTGLPADTLMAAADTADANSALLEHLGFRLAQAQGQKLDAGEEEVETQEYDPWEPFNEKMFEFNRRLDRYVLKPIAKVYAKIIPEPIQILINNGFDNIHFVPRFVNSLLQAKWGGAGRELARFVLNSTAGIGGLFDPAKDYWGIEKSREDFGQTLGVWGAPPGPYLVLPFLAPMTVRDGIGTAVDNAMDPLSYYLPLVWDRIGMKLGDIINERALNLDLYQGFEESVLDLYTAVRNAYLRRREQLIRE
jgi:phospholipid-binding lipoprotein MlaA